MIRAENNRTVFLVSHNSNLSGAPISLAQLAKKLPYYGYKPVYILPKNGPIVSILKRWNIEHVILRRRFRVLHFIGTVKKRDPVLVHVNSLVSAWPVMVSRLLRKPVVWHVREYLAQKKLYARLIHLFANRVVLISRNQYSLFEGMPRAELVPNGIDLTMYENVRPTVVVDRNSDDVRTVITYIGTIEPRKGLLVLAQAADLLRSSPWIHYVVVGDAPEKHLAYKRKIMNFLESANLQNRFHFLGWREDIPQILAASDALCHPAYIEAFGRVILEAMASKIPVIASATGDIPEILNYGGSGFLFEPGDFKSLAQYIKIIDTDTAGKLQMAKSGYARVFDKYSIETHTKKIADLYGELLQIS